MNKNVEKLYTQKEASRQSWDKFEKNRKRDWGLFGISTGIFDLDISVGGWIPKMVTTFAGRSGSGKSAMMHSFFDAGSKIRNGRRAEFLVCSWEMGIDRIIDREICRKLGVTQGMYTQGAKLFGDSTIKKIKEIYKQCSEYPIEYQTMSTDADVIKKLSIEFVNRCKEKEKNLRIEIQPVIIIDYLQMLVTKGGKQKSYEIADFINTIKQTANETGASYGIIAQLSKEADNHDMPSRNHLGESKGTEDGSDNIVLLYRPEHVGRSTVIHPKTGDEVDSKGKMLLRIQKARDYGTRDVLINCDIAHFRFWAEGMDWDTDFHKDYERKAFWMETFGLKQNEKQLKL